MITSRLEKNKGKRKKLQAEDTREKSLKTLSKFLKIFTFTFIIVAGTAFLIYYYSTSLLKVNEYSNIYNNLPDTFHGFKIVQFGDVYYNNYSSNIFNKTINKINKIKPDLIIFSGGFIHKKYELNDTEVENITKRLKELNATVGKYYVSGINDEENVSTILKNAGFINIDDRYEEIYFNGTTPIVVSGFLNNHNLDYKNSNNFFKIGVVNDPLHIEEIISNTSSDIMLSGKTLNGQIKIPYYKGLINVNKYTYYDKYYNVDNTDLYITSGLGTNNYPIRLFNMPSINFFRLKIK